MSNWPGHSWYNYFWNNNATIGYIRITVTPTWVNANTMDIYSMRYFCSYALDAGARLYDWDYNRNVTFPAFVDATQFRDTNNTAYYIDAASTSNLVGLTVANTITGSVSGNAGTATTLQTARNINGTSFNGSAAITTATWGTARTITIGSTGKSVDGSANVSWSLAELGAAATNQTMFIGTTSVAINRSSASQTLTGISIDGNAATVTNGVYTGTTNTLTGVNYFRSDKGSTSTVGTSNTYALQAFSNDAGAAGMSFHRGGYYAVNMGLDPDNILRIGGWSASANRLQLDMSGNLTVAGAMYGTNFIDSDNTAYFCNPASTSNLVGLTVANTITGNISGSSGSCTGNAATATTLQTARTIGGVSFNGSANIDLPGVNTAGNQNTSGNAANVTGTVAIANGGTGATSAAAARTNLGIANNYLYAKRTTNQTIASGNWANRDIIFNINSASSGIAYNTSTGVASLTGGKVYRITALLSWSRSSAFSAIWSLFNNADNSQLGPDVYNDSVTYTINQFANPTLDMILAPTSNIDVKIRTTSNMSVYDSSLFVLGVNVSLIIQQIA
jgi:hypothetical protein